MEHKFKGRVRHEDGTVGTVTKRYTATDGTPMYSVKWDTGMTERVPEEELSAVESESRKIADGRVEIPLRMLDGNLDVLLNHGPLECESIELRYDPAMAYGVILLIEFSPEQRAAADARGFKTTKVPK